MTIVALLLGALAAWYFASVGLSLSHYDARGHLTVARRVSDNITPGWRQFGALWLPFPHLLNLIPVRLMWNYQTGFSAIAINVGAMALGLGALARLVTRRTGSPVAAVAAALLVLCSPSILYLQSTPMTEPLLFALCWLALDAVDRSIDAVGRCVAEPVVGLWLAFAVLTRYEAWPIVAALVTVAALSLSAFADARRLFMRLAVWPVAAVVAFLLLGRLSLGRWLADAAFFTPDNPAAGRPAFALSQILEGYVSLAGWPVALLAGLGVAVSVITAWRQRSIRALLPLALAASAVVPLVAFIGGHPLRIRYMAPLVAASGAFIGIAIGAAPRRWRPAAATVAVALALWSRPPLSTEAPMTREARRELPAQLARAPITQFLAASYDRAPILASMGALGHYMQETSRAGLQIHDYVNEGNGDLWSAAIHAPRDHVGWVLIEEAAEGGDQLAVLSRADSHFLDGFTRVAEGGGAVLYRRVPVPGIRP